MNLHSPSSRLWLTALILGPCCLGSRSQILIDKQITIQPILIKNGSQTANSSHIFYEAVADKIWSQAGIDIKFLDPVVYDNSSFWNITSGTGSTSLSTLSGTILNGSSSDPHVLNMWFCNSINSSSGTLGLTLQSTPGDGFTITRNGLSIAANTFLFNASTVIAHEIGHSLGLDHSTFGASGTFNLMSQNSIPAGGIGVGDIYPDGSDYGQLTAAQITQARSVSLFVQTIDNPYFYGTPVPEPESIATVVAGALGAWAMYRRKTS